MDNKTYTIKLTDEALTDLINIVGTGPVILTGISLRARDGSRSINITYTDAVTERDHDVTIQLHKE